MKYLCWLLIIPVMIGVSRRLDRFDLSKYCVAHYKMNDNADSNDVIDSRGYSTGISQRNTSVVHTDGKVGGALTFNGSSDYIDTDDTFQSTFQDSFSVNLWCKPDDGQPSSPQALFSGITFGGEFQHWIGIEIDTTGKLFVAIYANNSGFSGFWEATIDNSVFSDGQESWRNVCIVVTPKHTVAIYFDGNLVDSSGEGDSDTNITNYAGTKSPYIGARNTDDVASTFFNGSIDNVMIFNKALSANEIKWLYKNGHGRENLAQGRRLK